MVIILMEVITESEFQNLEVKAAPSAGGAKRIQSAAVGSVIFKLCLIEEFTFCSHYQTQSTDRDLVGQLLNLNVKEHFENTFSVFALPYRQLFYYRLNVKTDDTTSILISPWWLAAVKSPFSG